LTYLWTTKDGIILSGGTTTSAEVKGLGTYYFQITDKYGCTHTDSTNVGLYIQAVSDSVETEINKGIYINVVKNDIPKNSADPSSISIITPPMHGNATVDADSLIYYLPQDSYTGHDEFIYQICDYFKNCDQAKVLVLVNDVPLFIPEAFSPNGDGINDKFEMKGLLKYKSIQIEIVNRWGNVVYRSSNYGEGSGITGVWDGTASMGTSIGSGSVPSGTYFFILTLDGKEKISKSVYLDR
jgi:gliding motility-associated-like protein